MSTIDEITHDAGGAVAAYYTFSVSDTDGRASITMAAAISGAYGLAITQTGTNSVSLQETLGSTISSGALRLRVYFDPNSCVAGSGEQSNSVSLAKGGTAFALIFIKFKSIGTYVVQPLYGGVDFGSEYTLSDGAHCLEIAMTQGTGTATGAFYIDDTLQESVSGKTYTGFTAINRIIVSSNVIQSGQSGTFYIDQILVDDDDTVSLCITNQYTIAPMRKPADTDADGSNIYLALLNSGGTPVLLQIDTGLATNATQVFAPGAGDDIGVQCGRFNASIVYVAGAFDGTNVVERSADAGSTFTVIDDGTFGDVETFIIGPDSDDRVWIFDSDNGDIQETIDAGTNWTAINSSVTPVIRAVDRLGINVQEAVFGNALAASDNADYSVNSGSNLEDLVFPVEVDITGIIVN